MADVPMTEILCQGKLLAHAETLLMSALMLHRD